MVLVLIASSYVDWGRRYRIGCAQASGISRRIAVWSALAAAATAAVLSFNDWYDREEKPRKVLAGFPVELSSVCNVNPELGENLFLASSDEERKLTLWRLDESGSPQVVQRLELNIPLQDGPTLHLDDLEDLAWDQHETYYAVSSHRHLLPEEDAARRKKSRGTECALVSFQLQQIDDGIAVTNTKMIAQDLLAKIRALGVFPSIDWKKSKMFSWRGLVKTWQLDIEGLAYVDGRLLLGFKDPIEDGKAAILSYDATTGELKQVARPDFDGHGILSMHYDSASDRLLVLSNDPIKHRYGDSFLWIGSRTASNSWDFSPQHRVVLEPANAKTRRKASGLTVHQGKLAVCFDSESEAPIRVIAMDRVLPRQY
jgi:hypothetical protein